MVFLGSHFQMANVEISFRKLEWLWRLKDVFEMYDDEFFGPIFQFCLCTNQDKSMKFIWHVRLGVSAYQPLSSSPIVSRTSVSGRMCQERSEEDRPSPLVSFLQFLAVPWAHYAL